MRVSRPARSAAAATVALALAMAAGAALAHVISDREIKLLQALPSGRVSTALAGFGPDTAGLCAENRAGWAHVTHQQDAMLLLCDAAARGDSAAAEAAWRAVDAAFVHQKPDSLFDVGRAPGGIAPRDPGATAEFLGALCRAQVALENSPLQKRFHWRVVLMMPKLKRSLDAMVARGDAFERTHAGDAAALLAGAQACLVGDGIYHVTAYGLLGQRLLVAALALQSEDGRFAGPGDAALAQANALLRMQSILCYFPAPSLERAEARGAGWLAARVSAKGVLRDASGPNAARVRARATVALSYAAQRGGNQSLAAAAQRLASAR